MQTQVQKTNTANSDKKMAKTKRTLPESNSNKRIKFDEKRLKENTKVVKDAVRACYLPPKFDADGSITQQENTII